MYEWLRHNRDQRLNRARPRQYASPGTRMACPTPRMLARRTQHHPLSATNAQTNHGKRNSGPQRIVLPAAELRDTGRRRRRWCHDNARSQRRSDGMDSSSPMLMPSPAIFTAVRSRVCAHSTTCCATSIDVAQQHVQRSATGRISTVSECGGPVRIIYQPSVTRHALVQARNGARSIGPISTRIAVQPPSCRWCPRRGMAATHGQPWCQ